MSELPKREIIARRIARELKDGFTVNLGIGMPTLCANYIPRGVEVFGSAKHGRDIEAIWAAEILDRF